MARSKSSSARSPNPVPAEVRIKVEACGVCHSDAFTKMAMFPGIALPRVPGPRGHRPRRCLGTGVQGWAIGDRVGVGWHGGQCGQCDNCRRGDFFACQVFHRITGITADGGYGEYMLAPQSALARVPSGLSAEEAAPLMCAGVTTFNSLRNSGARAGDLVAVLGLGGLGHLAVQYAAKMGFRVVGVSRGAPTRRHLRRNSAHTTTSTASRRTLPKNCGSSAVRRSSSPRRPAPRRCRPASAGSARGARCS